MNYSLLYDGDCKFCEAQSARLVRLARPGAIERLDFHADGVLARFPAVTYERCMRELVLVDQDGRAYGGMEAVARALATRWFFAPVALVYGLPGVRQLADAFYRVVARNRYRILGRRVAAGECDGGSCALHFAPPGASAHETHGSAGTQN